MGEAMSGDVILATEGVTKRFGRFVALRDVSVSFRRGALTSIIGPNGAGKSTYFNVLSGAFRPNEGKVFFEGTEITGRPQHDFAHLGIAKSFQITSVFPELPALENVRIALQARRVRYDLWRPRSHYPDLVEGAASLLALVGIAHRASLPARVLAHGEQRALEIAMALASEPQLLLLDEPTAGMSPEETRSMMDLIVKLARERTVILVEHKMKLVMGISDRLIVLHHGELLAEGTPDEIRRNDLVRRVYLGQQEV
jgi:branched-chain amino acid transport system ATP-binding protein